MTGGREVGRAEARLTARAGITTLLQICRAVNRDIRRVEIELGTASCEVIDDFMFDPDPLRSLDGRTTINFDDRPEFARISTQYAGLDFPDRPWIRRASSLGSVITTISPPNALEQYSFGREFDEDPLRINFTRSQAWVRVHVGAMVGRTSLRAFTPTTGRTPAATVSTDDFPRPGPITTPLEICRLIERDINRIEIQNESQDFERIDDLQFAGSRVPPPPRDTQPPRVFIDSPRTGDFFFRRDIRIRARITEDRDLERVVFIHEQLDGTDRREDGAFIRYVSGRAPNFTLEFNVSLFPGRNRIRIEAYDVGSNPSTNPEREVIVTLAPPMVVIIDSPRPGQIFSRSPIPVAGRVRKEFGTLPRERVRLQVYAGERVTSAVTARGTTGTAPEFRFSAMVDLLSGDPDQSNTIVVEALSEDGAVAQASVSVIYSLPNVFPIGLEVTQATQYGVAVSTRGGPYGVPLAAGRPTVVRIYAARSVWMGGRAVSVDQVQLRGSRHGAPLPESPLTINQLKSVTVTADDLINPLREDASRTWNFLLPRAWTEAGQIELIAQINSNRSLQECDRCFGDNEWRTTIRFEDVGSLRIQPVIVGFRDDSSGGTREAPIETALCTLQALLKVYPIWGIQMFIPAFVTVRGDASDSAVLDALARGFGHLAGNTRVYGLKPGGDGLAFGRYATGPATDQTCGVELFSQRALSWGAAYAAHELGHTFGLCHASDDHGESSGGCTERDWPYPHGGIGEVGFDVYRMEALAPGTPSGTHAHDFMSYGGNDRRNHPVEWVSPLTWRWLFDQFRVRSRAREQFRQTQHPQPSLFVYGAIDPQTGAVEKLFPIYRMELPADDDSTARGTYRLELRDRAGRLLLSRAFDPVPLEDDPEGKARFQLVIPAHEEATRVVILRRDEVLATREASPTVPRVQLLSPQPGEMWDHGERVIRWQASDTDGDPLFHAVQYSADGGANWQTLAIDLTENQWVISPDELPGSSSGLIRVLTSDGFHTAVATLAAPLQVMRKPPRAFIIAPADGAILDPAQGIVLQAIGSDHEDGPLPDKSFVWKSDRDGLLGTGMRVDAVRLSPGVHRITLTATDSDGESGEASIIVRVTEQRTLTSTPGLSGSVDNVGRVNEKSLTIGNGSKVGQPPREQILRGFVSFDLAGLPGDAEIVAAQLALVQKDISGDPYSKLGSVIVDLVDYGASLDAADFEAPVLVENLGTLSEDGLLNVKRLDVTEAVRQALARGLSRVQFRLRFSQETDDDGGTDSVVFDPTTSTQLLELQVAVGRGASASPR